MAQRYTKSERAKAAELIQSRSYTCGECGSKVRLIDEPPEISRVLIIQKVICDNCGDDGVVMKHNSLPRKNPFKWFENTPHELKTG